MDKTLVLSKSEHFEKIKRMGKPRKNSVNSGASVRRCEVDITGRDTPKDLSSALPRLRNDDAMTLKWTDTGDNVLITRIKNHYTVGFSTQKTSDKFDSEFDLQTTVKVLKEFRQSDYEPEKFLKFLRHLTPLAAGETNHPRQKTQQTQLKTDAKSPTRSKEVKPEDIQEIVSQSYRERASQFKFKETQEIIAQRIRAGQRRFPRIAPPPRSAGETLGVVIVLAVTLIIILGAACSLYDDLVVKPRQAREAFARQVADKKAADEKAAKIELEDKKYLLEHPYVETSPNYNATSDSDYKSVLGRVWVGTE